jgi:hypothetical protein
MRIQCNEEMVGAGHPTKADTLNRLVLVEHNTDGTHLSKSLGYLSRVHIYKSNTTQITLAPLAADIGGLIYTLDAATAKTISASAGTQHWEYLYAEAPSSGLTLSASEITHSATAPAYSAAYKGWYDGDKRCIGVVPVSAANQVETYHQIGQTVTLSVLHNILSTSTPATSSTLLATNLPVLGNLKVNVGVTLAQAGVTMVWAYVEDGELASGNADNGLLMSNDHANATCGVRGEKSAVTDSSQRIRYHASGGATTISISLRWFELPWGF